MNDQQNVAAVEHLIEAWNATSDADREAHLAKSVADDVDYVDAHAPDGVQGRAALAELIKHFRDHHDHPMTVDGAVSTHNGYYYVHWRLEHPDGGERHSAGASFGQLNADGLATRIVQFVDSETV